MKTKSANIQVKYETLVTIWAGLLLSQLAFIIVVYFVRPELFTFDPSRPRLGTQPLVTIVLAIGAVVVFVLSFVLRNQHIRRAISDRDAGCVQTGLVLACALAEVCAIVGLILALFFHYQYFYFWNALGIVGVLLHFPRKSNLDSAQFASSRI